MSNAIVEMMRNRPGGGTPLPRASDEPSYGTFLIGLDRDRIHPWLLGQQEVWIDQRACVHFIPEMKTDHLGSLQLWLLENRMRLLTKHAGWRGLRSGLQHHRFVDEFATSNCYGQMVDTPLYRAIMRELEVRHAG